MIWKIVLWSIVSILALAISYVMTNITYPKFSEIADVKTVSSNKIAWNVVTSTYCIWDCTDYSSDSRWGSSYWWWK